jgi:hypothetical protein
MVRTLVVSLSAVLLVAMIACGTSSGPTGFGNENNGASSSGDPFGNFGDASREGSAACVNLQCQQAACPSGSETTLTGTVYAPNGTLPIYNAIVYVPNAAVAPNVKGVTCDKCGTVASGSPVVSTLTDSSGRFKLERVPVGANIPLVIQLGKWRRQVVIPTVAKCVENPLKDANITRLPRNQSEGDIPKIAVTTGGCDQVGCMLPKIGIDANEIGTEADGDAKAVHVFNNPKPFWSDINKLKKYDLSVFSCECDEEPTSKGPPAYKAVAEYLASGGRIFTTDFQYTWYKYSPDPGLKSITSIAGGAPFADNPLYLNDTFPKGKALADWLQVASPGEPYGQVSTDAMFDNFQSPLDATKSQLWATENPGGVTGHARVFTANTPVGAKVEEQCGKAVHIDAHVNSSDDFPTNCASPLQRSEAMFAFFFFDLASCIQKEDSPPVIPK